MTTTPSFPEFESWPRRARAAALHAVSLAHSAITCSRGWCADSPLRRVQLQGQLDQAKTEIALLREELRIKDGRMSRIEPHRRPFYPPTARMTILELKAARAWNLPQTARAFLLETETVAAWMKRLGDPADDLVQLSAPVNKFPQLVGHLFAVFKRQPSSQELRACLGRAMGRGRAKPKHLISDRGAQFDCHGFTKWAKRKKVRLRYGAVGKYGSIAIIERFIRSLISPFRQQAQASSRRPGCHVGTRAVRRETRTHNRETQPQ